MSENWKLIESEKSDLINSLEFSLNELKEVLEDAKKSKINDDRQYIYLQGYANALGDIIHILKYHLKGEIKYE